jgi:hypothetical protein
MLCKNLSSYLYLWIASVFQIPKIWWINMQDFQAKSVLTDGIDMYESGSCHHMIYSRSIVYIWDVIYVTLLSIYFFKYHLGVYWFLEQPVELGYTEQHLGSLGNNFGGLMERS